MLKLFAITVMFIDHFALVALAPLSLSLDLTFMCRLIGRLAMPIFAYQVANGFIHTKNFNNYLMRILAMTLIAQIPFFLMLNYLPFSTVFSSDIYPLFLQNMNVGWTFMCALILLEALTGRHIRLGLEQAGNLIQLQSIIIKVLIIFIISHLAPYGDYGMYGILMVCLFYVVINYQLTPLLSSALLGLLTLGFFWSMGLVGCVLQMACTFSILAIRYIPDTRFKHDKWIFYTFYPLHMLLLVFIFF